MLTLSRSESVAANRTADLLPIAAQVVSLRFEVDCGAQVDEALMRLALGVPDNLIEIAEFFGRDLPRPEYLRMTDRGVHDLNTLAALPDEELADLISKPGLRRRLRNRGD